jgi:ComF family protein
MNPFFQIRDLFYPRLCAACEHTLQSYEEYVCIKCIFRLPKLEGKTQVDVHLLDKKFWGKIPVKFTRSFLPFSKSGHVQNILHQIKYQNQPHLAVFMGKWFGEMLKKEGFENETDLIVGIPLHIRKKKERGYNQADLFAKGLSESLDVPFDSELLIRSEYTETQTKKSRYKRFENMEKVFHVKFPERLEKKRVCLVDDVLTTGATLETAGNELLKNGAKELSIVTIASAL